jgi:hypothetical protein
MSSGVSGRKVSNSLVGKGETWRGGNSPKTSQERG